jgi:hypothetical protein
MGIRVVVREERGKVIAALSKTIVGLFEPTSGEALASYHAASLCRELGIQQACLEEDAKIIVDALNSNSSTWSRYGHIVEDMQSVLMKIPRWSCVNLPRRLLQTSVIGF